MKFTLLAIGFAAIAAATPTGSEIFPRAACTNGIEDPTEGPCSYNVTCSSLGSTTAKALATQTGDTFGTCLDYCSNYQTNEGTQCGSLNYKKSTKTCTLYTADTFKSTAANTGYDSAILYGCG